MYRTGIYLYVYWTNWNKVVWKFMKPTAFDGFEITQYKKKLFILSVLALVSFPVDTHIHFLGKVI